MGWGPGRRELDNLLDMEGLILLTPENGSLEGLGVFQNVGEACGSALLALRWLSMSPWRLHLRPE